jgi:hypothetical protein
MIFSVCSRSSTHVYTSAERDAFDEVPVGSSQVATSAIVQVAPLLSAFFPLLRQHTPTTADITFIFKIYAFIYE